MRLRTTHNLWATGVHGVLTPLAKRKSDGFDSHVVHLNGRLFQRREGNPYKIEVVGSSPTSPTIKTYQQHTYLQMVPELEVQILPPRLSMRGVV